MVEANYVTKFKEIVSEYVLNYQGGFITLVEFSNKCFPLFNSCYNSTSNTDLLRVLLDFTHNHQFIEEQYYILKSKFPHAS